MTDSKSMYPREQTDAAKALPVLDLAVGTYLSWMEERGFDRGAERRWGVITKVTAMSYLAQTTFGSTARISRTLDAFERRGVVVMLAPEEYAEIRRALKAQAEANEVARQQRLQEEAERERRAWAHKDAAKALRERHQEEYDALVAQFLGDTGE